MRELNTKLKQIIYKVQDDTTHAALTLMLEEIEELQERIGWLESTR